MSLAEKGAHGVLDTTGLRSRLPPGGRARSSCMAPPPRERRLQPSSAGSPAGRWSVRTSVSTTAGEPHRGRAPAARDLRRGPGL